MERYFGLKFEFDKDIFLKNIHESIRTKKKGYFCVVDANVLTMAQKNEEYRQILNDSMFNACDGSSIASLANLVYKTRHKAFNGPEIFEYFIESDYKQILLGSTNDTINRIKNKLIQNEKRTDTLSGLPLPFLDVDSFNYKEIATQINQQKPDIIWVSLGAPKQEVFMNRILPYLDQGVLFGIGAAFNFYTGDIPLPRYNIRGFRFIWLSRWLTEPKKLTKRIVPYLLILPKLYLSELKAKRRNEKRA